MNRYPLWIYLLIAAVLVTGFLFHGTDSFGTSPAVQVAPLKPTLKADTALLASVEELLKKGGIAAEGLQLDDSGVKARLADSEAQLKAKDYLKAQLGDDYVVALNQLSRSPQWLSSIGALPHVPGP